MEKILSIRTSGGSRCSRDRAKLARNQFNGSAVLWFLSLIVLQIVLVSGTPIGASNGHTQKREVSPNPFESATVRAGNASFFQEELSILGIRVDSSGSAEYEEEGIPSLLVGSEAILRIFGSGITSSTVIALTRDVNKPGGSCLLPVTKTFPIIEGSNTDGRTALVKVVMPDFKTQMYICAKNDLADSKAEYNVAKPLIHQGSTSWLRVHTHTLLLPVWASIVVVITCLCFSALFSGLNLGLMSMDRTELKILKNTGTPTERKYAERIAPVREHGNYLLCAILLGNVLVNSIFTILLDGLTSGLVAVIFSTIAIVLFGEITPQAICSRHGLAIGAKTIHITKVVMALTFPLSYPVSKFLDFILGEEIGTAYNRERLKELIRVTTGDLDKDEVNIISGALELRKKTVGEVMTHIDDAFMLSLDALLNFETVSEIMKSGFSRIPVYDGNRKNIVTLLYIKDLAFVDTDDNTPLKTLCEFYQNPCHFVFEDVTLDVMFKQFKEGHKGHMAFVHRVNNEGEGDPFYETVGLITLEDVIEELIQAEIMDETDVFTDNRAKVRRRGVAKQDFTVFAERRDNQKIHISPQLTLATFQFLSTSVDAFKPDVISEIILRRLLNQDIVHHIKIKGKEKSDPSILIFQQGKPVDFFVLILEGRVEVTVGRENLVFESGPFTYFGTQALVQNVGIAESPNQQVMGSLQSLNMDAMLRHTFVPDYSVRAITEVIYIVIKRNLYLAAKRATLLEKSQRSGEGVNEPYDDEVEKLLHSLDEDDRSIAAHTKDLNSITPSKGTSNTPSPTISPEHKTNGPTAISPKSTEKLLAHERAASEPANATNTTNLNNDQGDSANELLLPPNSKS